MKTTFLKKSELNHLIMQILLGIIEASEDDSIKYAVGLSINPELMWRRISQIYTKIMDQRSGNEKKKQKLSKGDVKANAKSDSKVNGDGSNQGKNKSVQTTPTPSQKHEAPTRENMRTSIDDNENIKMPVLDKIDEEDSKFVAKMFSENNEEYSLVMLEGLSIGIFIAEIMRFSEVIAKNLDSSFTDCVNERMPNIKKAREFFWQKIISIEILDPESNLKKVFFDIPQFVNYHSIMSKINFENEVKRESISDKLNALVDHIEELDMELRYNGYLFKKYGKLSNIEIFYVMKTLNFILMFIVNMIILFGKNVYEEVTTPDVAFLSWDNSSITDKSIFVIALF